MRVRGSVLGLLLIIGLAVQPAVAEKEWWDNPDVWWYKPDGKNNCPSSYPGYPEYVRTPDKCAPCTCGFRPGPGGGDTWQYPDGPSYPYQELKLKCNSMFAFLNVNGVDQVDRVGSYCGKGFRCRNGLRGPWCCPVNAVQRPKGFKRPNSKKAAPFCQNEPER